MSEKTPYVPVCGLVQLITSHTWGKEECVKLFKRCSVKLSQCPKVFYFCSSPPLPPWPQYLPQSPCPLHQLTGGGKKKKKGADFSPVQCRDLLTCTSTAKKTRVPRLPHLSTLSSSLPSSSQRQERQESKTLPR